MSFVYKVIVLIIIYDSFTSCIGNVYGKPRPIDVEIVIPTYSGHDSLGSIIHLKPAYTTGLALLREKYPTFQISNRFLIDPNHNNCYDVADNVQNMLAKWYYTEREISKNNRTIIPVIITPGKLINNKHIGQSITLIN
jgi:hypothetical protein